MRMFTWINHAAVVLVMLGLAVSGASGQTMRWEPANGPYGCAGVDIIQTAAGTFLLSDEYNGIWRSTDGCGSWQNSSTGMLQQKVKALAVLADGSVLAGSSDGPYRSTDDGLTWQHRSAGLPAPKFDVKDILLLGDGTLFTTAWDKGVFRSTDNGASWTAANNGLTQPNVYCLRRNAADHLFAGTYSGGIFRSTDRGGTWTQTSMTGYIYDIGVSPGGVLYAAGYNMGVHRSTDNGDSWTQSDVGAEGLAGFGFAFLGENDILFGAMIPQGMRRSTDGGASWQPFANGYSLSWTAGIYKSPQGDCFATTYHDAVYRLQKDSSAWRQLSNGVQGSSIYALQPVAGVGLFAGGYGGVFLSQDAGGSWNYVDRSVGFWHVYDLLFAHNALYAVGNPGAVRRTTDNGAHWTTMNTGITTSRAQCICIAPNGRLFVGTDSYGVFRSTDQGASWTACNTGLAGTNIQDVCSDAAGKVYAATGNGLYVSNDAGDHWSKFDGGLPDEAWYSVHAKDGMLYAGSYGGLYRSSDGGITWTRTNESQIFNTPPALTTDRSGAVLVAVNAKFLRSTDHGATWETLGDGLPSASLLDVAEDAQGGLYVSSVSRGVYRLAQSSGADVEVTVTTAPPGRRLTIDGQVYSNPHTFTWPLGSSHNISTTSPQQGSPGIRYVWNSWSNGQPMSHFYTVASGAALTLTANFAMEYSLTMNAGTGGTVTPGTTWQTVGAQVQILATPNPGYAFDRWSGSGAGSYTGTDNPATITISSTITETAQFRQVTGTDENAAVPRTLVLRQNAPNPCVGNTMFEIGLPHPQSVTLVITDLLGRECARVLDRAQLGAGTHVTAFDATALKPGVYLYRLDAESGMRAGRMVVMR